MQWHNATCVEVANVTFCYIFDIMCASWSRVREGCSGHFVSDKATITHPLFCCCHIAIWRLATADGLEPKDRLNVYVTIASFPLAFTLMSPSEKSFNSR